MSRAAWIDAGVGAVLVALAAALSLVSAHLAPSEWRVALYALGGLLVVLQAVQTFRSVRGAISADRAFSELRAEQEYLAQPESSRYLDLVYQQHAGLTAAEEVFQQNFDIDSRDSTATRVRCRRCGWKAEKALLYAREDAVQHYRAWHLPPEQTGSRLRRLLRLSG